MEIEPSRYLTFEYIGPTDYFNEAKGGERIRGSRCTSVDAAFRYRTSTGQTELALVEWKYTEAYLEAVEPPPGYNKTRDARYRSDLEAPDGPIRPNLIDLELLFDEPLYQLMRQQLLAYRLERDHVEDADVVRVLHVLDPDNAGYQQSLVRPETKPIGDSVDAVWSMLLRSPDHFAHLDPAVFLDPAITSTEYVDRYSQAVQANAALGAGVVAAQQRKSMGLGPTPLTFQAPETTSLGAPSTTRTAVVLADKGFPSRANRAYLAARAIKACRTRPRKSRTSLPTSPRAESLASRRGAQRGELEESHQEAVPKAFVERLINGLTPRRFGPRLLNCATSRSRRREAPARHHARIIHPQ